MATRLYFGNGAPPVSPSFTAGWEATAGAVRRLLEPDKGIPGSGYETRAVATALNSPAGAVDILLLQLVSAPLASNVTIAGAIRGQVRALESNAAADLDLQCVMWVMKTDGTARGTLFTFDATALGHEFNTALRNLSIPKGGSATPTSVAALATDRIVVELGYRKHESATTSRTGTIEAGAPSGTDLPVDETTTTQGVPWVEFTEALSFSGTPGRIAQAPTEVAVSPTSQNARAAQLPTEVAVSPTSQNARAAQLPIEVLHAVVTSARAAQVPVEVIMLAVLAARVGQIPVEVIMAVGAAVNAQIAQAAIEVLHGAGVDTNSRYGQMPVEVIMAPDAAIPARTRIVWIGG